MTAGERRAAASSQKKEKVVTASHARSFIRREHDGLFVDFPKHHGDRSKGPINLSFLLTLEPDLRDALAEGYTIHCLKGVNSADGRYEITSRLRTGLMRYLAQPDVAKPSLAEVDEAFLHRFKAWLDDPTREGFSSNQITRMYQLSAVQHPLGRLMKSRDWKAKLSPRLRLIERPYPKASNSVEHKEALDEAAHERLYSGAARDIAETVGRLTRQWERMAIYDGASMSMAEAGRSPEACAAWLDANFSHPVPSHYEQGRLDADYPRLIPQTIQEQAERILYPGIDELVPMLLIVTAFFALNPTLAFKLKRDGVDYAFYRLGDVTRLRMYPNKRRASLRQRNTVTVTDHPDNPGRILQFLEKRTDRLRGMRPEAAERIFLRFSFETRKAVPFNVSDDSWRAALKRFCDRHRLPEFTLDQLRPTTLDLVHELSGGNIIAMQGVATHTDTRTTYTFYTSDAQRQRNRQTLGEMLLQMERYVATGGKIRPEDRPPGIADQGAATPGFTCLDPKDSPISGEKPGELCAAYGHCPACPLAVVDPTSPRSLAFLVMLNKRITEAQHDLADPLAWHLRWAPVQEELLTYWLQGWDPKVAEESRRIPIPELPPLE